MSDEIAVPQEGAHRAEASVTQELKEQIQLLTVLNNSYLKEIRGLKQQNEYLNFQIRSSRKFGAQKIKRNDTNQYMDHYSFRIGNIIIDAVRKPGKNTIMMPIRMIKLMFEIIAKRKARKVS